MKKRILAACMVLLLLAFCGCSKQDSPNTESTPSTSGAGAPGDSSQPAGTADSTPPTTQAATEPSTEPTTVPTTLPETEPTTVPTTAATEPPLSTGDLVALTASAQVGKEYLYGGSGPDQFDTSGLVYFCFLENGISVPRSTSSQAAYGTEVAKDDLQPGDVVFFWTDTPGSAQFVGIYIGGNAFVSASSTKGTVRQMEITSSYYTEHYVFARRFA